MIVSFNEVESTGRKAARGVGMSWGMAEEAGKAARWLAVHGLPGPELLASHLVLRADAAHADVSPASTGSDWEAPGRVLCPIVAGTALCDRAHEIAAGREFRLAATSYPALLAFHLVSAAELTGAMIELSWPGVTLVASGDGASIDGTHDAVVAPEVEWVRCRVGGEAGEPRPQRSGGREVDHDEWATLSEFAGRTYAPATEESRLSGAGAGLIDD